MTEKELEEAKRSIREYSKKINQSKESAREALYRAGICTKDGKLTKPYRIDEENNS